MKSVGNEERSRRGGGGARARGARVLEDGGKRGATRVRTRPVEDRARVVLARVVVRWKGLVLARAVGRVSREEVEGARDARDTTARRAEEKRAARGDARDRSGRERGHGGVAERAAEM